MTENPAFLTDQLITCLGNKRSLLPLIGQGVDEIRRRVSRDRVRFFDAFSGSGVVARYFKQFASLVIVNDLERYSRITNACYLANPDPATLRRLDRARTEILAAWETPSAPRGFLAELYAPRDDQHIQPGERVFYTTRNARFLDAVRQLVDEAPADLKPFLLAPLLAEASIHTNTSGVFKGFHRNAATGLGEFGGRGKNALSRILADISLPLPVFSRYEVPFDTLEAEAAAAAQAVPEVDVAYLDPPYNQHPYGSNYFMLNLIATYQRPHQVSRVSGIPVDWNRSAYNSPSLIREALGGLIEAVKARFVLVSFNSEGFLTRPELEALLGEFGSVAVFEQTYPTFRGSRNLAQRRIHVQEYLFLLEKSNRRVVS